MVFVFCVTAYFTLCIKAASIFQQVQPVQPVVVFPFPLSCNVYLRQVSDAFFLCRYNGIGFKACANRNLVRSVSRARFNPLHGRSRSLSLSIFLSILRVFIICWREYCVRYFVQNAYIHMHIYIWLSMGTRFKTFCVEKSWICLKYTHRYKHKQKQMHTLFQSEKQWYKKRE